MEIPFPIPFSVILSPIHIRNALPAVRVATAQITFSALYWSRYPCLPKAIAMAEDWIRASPTVTYLVIDAIFFLPSSPSRCISSSLGMAMVSSCMMMDEVI